MLSPSERVIYQTFRRRFDELREGYNMHQVVVMVDEELGLESGRTIEVLRKEHPIRRVEIDQEIVTL